MRSSREKLFQAEGTVVAKLSVRIRIEGSRKRKKCKQGGNDM